MTHRKKPWTLASIEGRGSERSQTNTLDGWLGLTEEKPTWLVERYLKEYRTSRGTFPCYELEEYPDGMDSARTWHARHQLLSLSHVGRTTRKIPPIGVAKVGHRSELFFWSEDIDNAMADAAWHNKTKWGEEPEEFFQEVSERKLLIDLELSRVNAGFFREGWSGGTIHRPDGYPEKISETMEWYESSKEERIEHERRGYGILIR